MNVLNLTLTKSECTQNIFGSGAEGHTLSKEGKNTFFAMFNQKKDNLQGDCSIAQEYNPTSIPESNNPTDVLNIDCDDIKNSTALDTTHISSQGLPIKPCSFFSSNIIDAEIKPKSNKQKDKSIVNPELGTKVKLDETKPTNNYEEKHNEQFLQSTSTKEINVKSASLFPNTSHPNNDKYQIDDSRSVELKKTDKLENIFHTNEIKSENTSSSNFIVINNKIALQTSHEINGKLISSNVQTLQDTIGEEISTFKESSLNSTSITIRVKPSNLGEIIIVLEKDIIPQNSKIVDRTTGAPIDIRMITSNPEVSNYLNLIRREIINKHGIRSININNHISEVLKISETNLKKKEQKQ